MHLWQKIIFLSFFFLIFLFEGLGLPRGHDVSYYLILACPFFFFFLSYLQKKTLIIPKKITFLFLLFLLFSTISTIFSVNLQRSFEYLLYYFAVFLTFIFVYNYKKELLKPTIILIFVLAFIFTGYSLIIQYVKLPDNLTFLIPTRSYQYVYPYFKTHNTLGPFLLIPLTLSLTTFFPFFLLFLLPFLLSYSRSSYLALGLTLLVFALTKTGLKWKIFAGLIVGLCVVLFFATVGYKKPIPVISEINNLLAKNFHLNNKEFLSSRDIYFKSALLSIKEKPLFGLGPYNFLYATEKYANKYSLAETADNIFLEVFSENGILAGIIFFIIISLLLLRVRNSILFFTFLVMLILFQTDSSQRYYSYLLLFFCLGGLIYEEKINLKINSGFFFLIATVLLLFSQLMISSKIFYLKGNYQLAFYSYPLDSGALLTLTYQELYSRNYKNMFQHLALYEKIAPKDYNTYHYLSLLYLRLGDIVMVARYHHKAQQFIK